jgi:COMPASS component SWD1
MWEVVEDRLARERTTCCAWNRRGTMLACGTSNGTIVIWCWDTRATTREFRRDEDDGERAAVLSVHWSLDGRKIVAAKSDGVVEVWDALEEDVIAVMSNVGLCSSVSFAASNASGTTVIVSPSVGRAPYVRGTSARGQKEAELPSSLDVAVTGLAVSSKKGRYVFVGDARGTVSVVDASGELRLVQSISIPDATLVKRLELCRNGKHLLAVTNGQKICGFDVDEAASDGEDVLTRMVEYESPSASRLQWSAAAYPWNGEYVYGMCSGAAHEMHVWDRASGELKCVLEGPAEAKGVVQLAAHPIRDVGIALGSNGNIYVWARKHKEDWSAFDPTFTTLVDNKEYVEKEDEFDAKPPVEKQPPRALEALDPARLPDLLKPTVNDYYTDDTDDDVLHALPIRIKPNPEVAKLMEERKAKWAKKAARKEREEREKTEAAKKAKETGGEN